MNSPDGLFVTIFYAVLTLDSGDLVYANAGHNLPLLIRTDQDKVDLLVKGGTALGVLNKPGLEDHHVTIHANDSLLMYTDGATETFTPTGDIYGEERLYQLI